MRGRRKLMTHATNAAMANQAHEMPTFVKLSSDPDLFSEWDRLGGSIGTRRQ
jgi:hypothetical protein